MDAPILILGSPRSGTTWLARALTSSGDVWLHNEPDNDVVRPAGAAGKRGLGRHPDIDGGTVGARRRRRYDRLWRRVAAGLVPPTDGVRARFARRLLRGCERSVIDRAYAPDGPLAPRLAAAALVAPLPSEPGPSGRLVVKSVHAVRSGGHIVDTHGFSPLLVRRDPLDIVSSWYERGLGPGRSVLGLDVDVPQGLQHVRDARVLSCIAADVAALDARLIELEGRGWPSVAHEQLAADPLTRVPELAERMGLPWDGGGAQFLRRSSSPGRGYETSRVPGTTAGVHAARLDDTQVALVERVLCDHAAGRRSR